MEPGPRAADRHSRAAFKQRRQRFGARSLEFGPGQRGHRTEIVQRGGVTGGSGNRDAFGDVGGDIDRDGLGERLDAVVAMLQLDDAAGGKTAEFHQEGEHRIFLRRRRDFEGAGIVGVNPLSGLEDQHFGAVPGVVGRADDDRAPDGDFVGVGGSADRQRSRGQADPEAGPQGKGGKKKGKGGMPPHEEPPRVAGREERPSTGSPTREPAVTGLWSSSAVRPAARGARRTRGPAAARGALPRRRPTR